MTAAPAPDLQELIILNNPLVPVQRNCLSVSNAGIKASISKRFAVSKLPNESATAALPPSGQHPHPHPSGEERLYSTPRQSTIFGFETPSLPRVGKNAPNAPLAHPTPSPVNNSVTIATLCTYKRDVMCGRSCDRARR